MDRQQFLCPCNIFVVGPTNSGKTYWTWNLLKDIPYHFRMLKPELPLPKKILYCYMAEQELIRDMKSWDNVKTYKQVPTLPFLKRFFNDKPGIVVLDDMMRHVAKDEELQDLFTIKSHHENISVIFLSQDFFPRGNSMVTINRQCQYLVCFRSLRDNWGLFHVLLSAFPERWGEVLNHIRNDAFSEKYGYAVLNFHPQSDTDMVFWTHMLKDDPEASEGYFFPESRNYRSHALDLAWDTADPTCSD